MRTTAEMCIALVAAICLSCQCCCAAEGGKLTIVGFGDSTTAPRGKLRIYGKRLPAALQAKGVSATFINSGIGGNTTEMARARFERDVLAHNPDVVIIWFGINDSAIDVWRGRTEPRVPLAKYENNIRCFVDALKQKGVAVILMTSNPLAWTDNLRKIYGKPPYDAADPDGFNLKLKLYVAAVRKIAKDKAVPLVDVHQIFRHYAAQPRHAMLDLLLDGMHPNDKGHGMVTDALVPVVIECVRKRGTRK